jgi:hypothetical protein
MQSARSGRSATLSLLRAAAFLTCAAFIFLAPAYREFFDQENKVRLLPDWKMFSTASLNLFEVRFETGEGKDRRELDRISALGYESFSKAPRSVRTVVSEAEAWSLARSLCRRGHNPLYMRLRDAKLGGWKVVEDGKADVCERATARKTTSGTLP